MSEETPPPTAETPLATAAEATASQVAPNCPLKKRRKLWVTLLILAPWWAPNVPPLKPWLERQIAVRTGWQCRIGYILPVSWDGRPMIGRLRLASRNDAESASNIHWQKVSFLPRWSALLKGQLILEELRLEDGEVELNPASIQEEAAPATEGTPNLPLLLSTKPLTPAAPDPEPEVTALASAETAPDEPPDPGVGLLSSLGKNEDRPESTSPTPDKIPTPVPEATVPPVREPVASAIASSPSSSTPSATQEPPPPPATTPPAPPQRRWSIERLIMDKLQVRVLMPNDSSRTLVGGDIASVNIPLGTSSGEGEVRLASCEVLGHTWAEPQTVPLSWEAGVLRIKEAALAVPGGTVTLAMHAEPLNPGAPLIAAVQGAALQAEGVYAWLTSQSHQPQDPATPPSSHLCPPAGLDFQLQLGGFLRWPTRSLQSRGLVEMKPTRLPVAAWLRAANWPDAAAILSEPEMPASSARLAFRSHGGTVAIDEASITAQDFILQSRGALSVSSGWMLATRTYVRESARGLLTHVTRDWPSERELTLTSLPNSPWAYLDVPVQGPLLEPSIGLWGQWWEVAALRAELVRLRTPPRPTLQSDE